MSRRVHSFGLLVALALASAGCGATPAEMACRDAKLIKVGMTQHQVHTLVGRSYRFEEGPKLTRWRIRYRKPKWVKDAFAGLFLSFVGWPALPFVHLFLFRHYKSAWIWVWFDGKGRVQGKAMAVDRKGRPIDCYALEKQKKLKEPESKGAKQARQAEERARNQ